MLKRLVEQRKQLSLARRVLKTRRILSEKGKQEIFSKNGRFSARRGGLESPKFISRRILVITFHKLYHQHLERFSIRSSEIETKSHRHLEAKSDKTRAKRAQKGPHIPGWGGVGVYFDMCIVWEKSHDFDVTFAY